MSKPKNIVLIGMPGVGKSTVGVLLAKQWGLSFLDTDIYIQTRENKSLQELIAEHGLSGFCDLEEDYVRSISLDSHVIATGGSVVYRHQAMEHLQESGFIIYLDIALDRLKKRLDDVNARGVVIAPGQKLRDLYAERHLLYLTYADVTVETNGLTPGQVVRDIVESLPEFCT